MIGLYTSAMNQLSASAMTKLFTRSDKQLFKKALLGVSVGISTALLACSLRGSLLLALIRRLRAHPMLPDGKLVDPYIPPTSFLLGHLCDLLATPPVETARLLLAKAKRNLGAALTYGAEKLFHCGIIVHEPDTTIS